MMRVLMRVLVLFILLATLVVVAKSAYCSGSPDAGERTNNFDIYDEDLVFVKEIQNGKLYEAGPKGARFPVVHLWGSPYEKGFAQGTLMKRQVRQFVYSTWAYLSGALIWDGDKIPKAAKEILILKGIDAALDWTSDVTAKFTSADYTDEVKGLSDASGVSYDLLWRLQMFAELTKASCSFFGAWNTATTDGKTYQLRALDYDTDGPFKDYPQVTVYHPYNNDGYAYAQVGWPGSIGSLTGINEKKVSISEIGVGYPDDSFGQGTDNTPPEKVHGEPWMFVLRDTLQFASSLNEAKDRVTNSNRTCNLIIGLGDGDDAHVFGTEYSGYVANYYDDVNQLPVNETWHPKITDVVYNGMDWLCPTYTGVLGEQLGKYVGSIDEYTVVKNILPTVQTGNLHIALYDLTDMNMHVSFARGASADSSEPFYAYERQFTRLHMNEIFQVSQPDM